jgi:hypothetical protein
MDARLRMEIRGRMRRPITTVGRRIATADIPTGIAPISHPLDRIRRHTTIVEAAVPTVRLRAPIPHLVAVTLRHRGRTQLRRGRTQLRRDPTQHRVEATAVADHRARAVAAEAHEAAVVEAAVREAAAVEAHTVAVPTATKTSGSRLTAYGPLPITERAFFHEEGRS